MKEVIYWKEPQENHWFIWRNRWVHWWQWTLKTSFSESGVWTWDHLSIGEWPQVGVIFCFNGKSCEGYRGIAIHFLVTRGEKTTAGSNYVCIFCMTLLLAETWWKFVKWTKERTLMHRDVSHLLLVVSSGASSREVLGLSVPASLKLVRNENAQTLFQTSWSVSLAWAQEFVVNKLARGSDAC